MHETNSFGVFVLVWCFETILIMGRENELSKIEVLDVIEVDGVMYTVDKRIEKRFKSVYALLGGLLAMTPTLAFAESTDTFNRIWGSLMTGLDYAAALIIVFVGISWMLGHRSKAIELLIAVACGFVLARHAIDIRDFLKTI